MLVLKYFSGFLLSNLWHLIILPKCSQWVAHYVYRGLRAPDTSLLHLLCLAEPRSSVISSSVQQLQRVYWGITKGPAAAGTLWGFC